MTYCPGLVGPSCLALVRPHSVLHRPAEYELSCLCSHWTRRRHSILTKPVGYELSRPARLQGVLPRPAGYELSCLNSPLGCVAHVCYIRVVRLHGVSCSPSWRDAHSGMDPVMCRHWSNLYVIPSTVQNHKKNHMGVVLIYNLKSNIYCLKQIGASLFSCVEDTSSLK